MDVQFLPGDVIFASAKRWPWTWIKPLTQGPGEGPTVATHVEAVALGGSRETCRVVAPRSLFVGEHPFPGVKDNDAEDVYVWRYKGWSDYQRDLIGINLLAQVGDLYGAHRLLGFAADNLIARGLGLFGYRGDVRVFSRLNCLRDLRVCSNVVAGAIAKATGYNFGRPPEETTPDGMWDHVSNDPDWERVYSHKWEAANDQKAA